MAIISASEYKFLNHPQVRLLASTAKNAVRQLYIPSMRIPSVNHQLSHPTEHVEIKVVFWSEVGYMITITIAAGNA